VFAGEKVNPVKQQTPFPSFFVNTPKHSELSEEIRLNFNPKHKPKLILVYESTYFFSLILAHILFLLPTYLPSRVKPARTRTVKKIEKISDI